MSRWKHQNIFGLLGMLVLMLWVGSIPSLWGQVAEVQKGGREIFLQLCAACHGTNAKGEGPLTSQTRGIPPNLTQLSTRNKGVFPFWHVYRVIDGRDDVAQHGPREMPAWGNWFQIPEDEGHGPTDWRDQVRGRLWQLLVYLESIQELPPKFKH